MSSVMDSAPSEPQVFILAKSPPAGRQKLCLILLQSHSSDDDAVCFFCCCLWFASEPLWLSSVDSVCSCRSVIIDMDRTNFNWFSCSPLQPQFLLGVHPLFRTWVLMLAVCKTQPYVYFETRRILNLSNIMVSLNTSIKLEPSLFTIE